jgi:hypothetical protein
MTLRLYANTGLTNSPDATALYTSDPIPVNLSFNTQTINFPLSSNLITLPDTFTWTVQFSNLAAGQTGGLLLYGPPSSGSSFDDFWQKDGLGNWSLMRINGGATLANFAAQVTAVPEPGVFALGAFGALVLAAFRRFRKASR